MLVETLILAALVTTIYLYTTRNFGYWKKRGIAYEKPVPIFGNLWDSVIFKTTAGEISADVYRKYPTEKVVGMFHFDSPVLLIRDAQLIYKILVADFNHFSENSMVIDENVDPVLSRNIFFLKGERWKKTRQMMTPAFAINRIKSIFEMVVGVGNKLTDFVGKHPEEVDLKYLMARYGAEIVATCSLGVDGRCFDEAKPRIVRIGQMIFVSSLIQGIMQMIVILLPNISRLLHVKMVPKEVPQFFDEILRDVIEYRQKNPDYVRQDLMQHWIEIKNKSVEVAKGNTTSDVITKELDDTDILIGCVTFFIESYETTSMVASFALHYLAVNKDLQDRLKRDIDDLYAASGGKLTYDNIADLTLLNNIISETLRLHPALLHSMKTCTMDYSMDVGHSQPLIVEKGTIVIFPNIAINKDPLFWKDPETFNPDRFNEMDKADWKKGAFFPFGEGPRMCIGIKMAYTVLKVGLILLLKDFEVVPSAKTPKKIVQDPHHFMSRNAAGLYAKFVKRV